MGKVEVKRIKESDTRTVQQAYVDICSLYLELLDYLEGVIPTLPEGLEEKYTEVRESSSIIAEYFRGRAERVQVDTPLSEKMFTPGYELIQNLERLPDIIREEVNLDILSREIEEGEVLLPDSGSETLNQIARSAKSHIRSGYEESSLFPEPPSLSTKEDYILQDRATVFGILLIAKSLAEEVRGVKDSLSPVMKKKYQEVERTTDIVLDSLGRVLKEYDSKDLSLEEAKRRYYNTKSLSEALLDLVTEKERDYKILRRDGKRVLMEFKSQSPESSSTLEDILDKIDREPKSAQIQVSKDLWESQFKSPGDTLSLIEESSTMTDTQKRQSIERIKKLQSRGKLLAGTTEGLSGGSAYLKVFTIALAQTLNEQVKYFKTEGDWSGVPVSQIPDIMGMEIEVEKKDSVIIKKESRSYPRILISYESLAKKISSSGKISGGKDADFIRDYIDTLKDKQYILDTGSGYVGVPYLFKEYILYSKEGKEIGCLGRLTPQFSKSVRGYTGLRSDTIQLLGGGKQKDITMDIFERLIFCRGISPVYRVRKDLLLDKYKKKSTYLNEKGYLRKSKLEADFKTAIQKVIDAKILLPGIGKGGSLNGYKEEVNPGGEVVSIFIYNPDYLKGEEILPEGNETE